MRDDSDSFGVRPKKNLQKQLKPKAKEHEDTELHHFRGQVQRSCIRFLESTTTNLHTEGTNITINTQTFAPL